MSKPTESVNSMQFVRVEFARAIASIEPGKPRHAWHWFIIVQDGHVSGVSNGFATLDEAVNDFALLGIGKVADAECRLAKAYARHDREPYGLAVVNPSKETK